MADKIRIEELVAWITKYFSLVSLVIGVEGVDKNIRKVNMLISKNAHITNHLGDEIDINVDIKRGGQIKLSLGDKSI